MSIETMGRTASVGHILRAAAVAVVVASLLPASPVAADIVHLDDVIASFSLCVGFDCINGEVFNADTIRLKENNLRIHFLDTSTAASFPSNDWRIEINSQNNGGGNYFAVEDATAARRVFQIEAGAPSSALYVDSGGRIGAGTSNPVVEVHIVDGDTPTVRLDQDGSSGFAPQIWDVAGNETSFFIRDATNGSTLPFRIQPGASSNVVFIASDDQVGLNTTSPDAGLHVVHGGDGVVLEDSDSGVSAEVAFEIRGATGMANVQLENTSTGDEWNYAVGSGGAYAILLTSDGMTGNELTLREQGQSSAGTRAQNTLDINGGIAADAFNNFSSRAAKTDFAPVDGDELLERLSALPITEWRFESDESDERHIGPVAEDFNLAFFGEERQMIGLGDASGIALAAIQGLEARTRRRDAELEALLAALAERLEELERQAEADGGR